MTQKYSDTFLDAHRHFNVEHDWWDSVYDDFDRVCAVLGVELGGRNVPMHGGGTRSEPDVNFSGFWSQGDGASWAGQYRAIRRGRTQDAALGQVPTYDTAPAEIRQYAPTDDALHAIADRLCMLSRIYGPLCAVVGRSSSRYCHEFSMQIDSWEYCDDEKNEDVPEEIAEHVETELLDIFRDLARWLYATLETEYDHLTSDEAVAESLEANEIKEEDDECLV